MQLVATVPLNAPPELRAVAEDVFRALARVRFVSVASLLAYAGPSGLTHELLDTWCRAGLLHRSRVQPDPLRPHEIEYLALTPFGARTLSGATGMTVQGIAASQLKRTSQKRMHAVLVGETALGVVSLAKEHQIELLGIETDDRKLGSFVHVMDVRQEPERIALQSDALIMTEGRAGPEALLVEVDRATTAPKRMQTKYRGYLAWQEQGGPFREYGTKALRVLTLVPTDARLEKLHAAALAANGGRRSGFLLFGLLDDFTVCTADRWLGLAARPLGGESGQRVRLLPNAPRAEAA